MTRPLIGVTTDLGAALWQDRIREAVLSPAAYGRAIERAGAVPVLLPPVLTGAAGRLCAGLDGLLLCGADAFEFALLQVALADGVPVLALARGLELLNVSQGGTVVAVPDGLVPAGNAGPGAGSRCVVRISPSSKLGAILGPAATVWPGQGLVPGQLGPGLTAAGWLRAETAEAVPQDQTAPRAGTAPRKEAVPQDQTEPQAEARPGEIVAAVEVTGHPFALGVWWRPEAGDDPAIFAALRDAAQRRAAVSPARAGFAATARKPALR